MHSVVVLIAVVADFLVVTVVVVVVVAQVSIVCYISAAFAIFHNKYIHKKKLTMCMCVCNGGKVGFSF